MRLHVSEDNGKGVGANVSLLPIRTCSACVKVSCAMPIIKKNGLPGKRLQCYACKFLERPAVRIAWTDNTKLYETDPDAYFLQLSQYLEKKRPKFFRYFVGGDFPNQVFVDRVCAIAKQFPGIKFLAFTKRWFDRYDFSRAPENLAIIYSSWPTLPVPPNDKPIAWLNDNRETRIPKNAICCPGRCDNCGMCWSLQSIGRDVYFDIH